MKAETVNPIENPSPSRVLLRRAALIGVGTVSVLSLLACSGDSNESEAAPDAVRAGSADRQITPQREFFPNGTMRTILKSDQSPYYPDILSYCIKDREGTPYLVNVVSLDGHGGGSMDMQTNFAACNDGKLTAADFAAQVQGRR